MSAAERRSDIIAEANTKGCKQVSYSAVWHGVTAIACAFTVFVESPGEPDNYNPNNFVAYFTNIGIPLIAGVGAAATSTLLDASYPCLSTPTLRAARSLADAGSSSCMRRCASSWSDNVKDNANAFWQVTIDRVIRSYASAGVAYGLTVGLASSIAGTHPRAAAALFAAKPAADIAGAALSFGLSKLQDACCWLPWCCRDSGGIPPVHSTVLDA